jgi:ATP-dependent Clp protease ATP-binding subunit ClpA
MAKRVSGIVPFMPFSKREQAVLAYKSLLRLADSLRDPVRPPTRFIGNVMLRICQDTALCQAIAREGYHVDIGAREIDIVVNRKVKNTLIQQYLETNSGIDKHQPKEEYDVNINRANQIVVRKRSFP